MVRKIVFKVNLDFIWKKLKFRGPITIYPRTYTTKFQNLSDQLKIAISHLITAPFLKDTVHHLFHDTREAVSTGRNN